MFDVADFKTASDWDRLRFLTSELRMTLQLLATGGTLRPGVASPQMIGLLRKYVEEGSQLRRTGQLQTGDAAAESTLSDYRTTLEQLHQILPKLEQQLRDDRARLAQEQNRLNLASDWTSTAKLTR
jgi:hypothetical protein